ILVVADGKYLWTYDIDLSQVTKQDLKKSFRNSPAALLAGSVSRLTKDFTVTYAKDKQCDKGVDRCFLLEPKQKNATFADILIGFAQDQLIEIRMHDPLGQDIYTKFSAVKMNHRVNSQLFAFFPPRGVDVIQPGDN
ncbi:MAG: outer-membrane lipoprotein carrier protein LolA, partial [Candidatus Berkiellales bacterium]